MARRAFLFIPAPAALCLLVVCSLAPLGAHAITVADLRARIARQEKLTVIDIRTPALFARSHIPGAINVPASLCAQKRLPALGEVVVYGGGLGRDETEGAAALASKPGLSVNVLEGGFAAWESAQALTTEGKGMRPEVLNYISYAQLKSAKAGEVVLVDLRKPPLPVQGAVADSASSGSQPLTDLSSEFPNLKVIRSPFDAPAASAGGGAATPTLLVLIDRGDGTAATMARTLKSILQNRRPLQ